MKRLDENKKRSVETVFAVICCFLMVFTGLGFTSSPKSLFLKAITEALEIPRSLFSLNDTSRYVVTAVLSIYFGTMVQKFGTKKLIMAGFAMLVGSMALYAVAEHLVVFYIAGMLLGAGLSFVGSTMASYVVKRRCTKYVGTIQGLVMAANGLGGSVAVQFVSPMIESAPLGYRKAYWGVAIIIAAVAVLVAILFKEDKSVPHTQGAGKKKARGQGWDGMPYEAAKKRPYYLILCLCMFLTGFVLSGINGISTAHMRDVGIDAALVTNIMSVHSLMVMVFKFSTGVIYDWKGLRTTLLVGQISAAVVLIALSLASPSDFGIAMALVYSIFSGVALPLETIGVSLVTGDIFGNRDYAKLLGIMSALNYMGFALGGPVANLTQDLLGTYVPAIVTAAIVMVVVAVVFQFIITAAHKDRAQFPPIQTEN